MARNLNTHNFTETEMIFRRNIIYLREKAVLQDMQLPEN